MTKTVLLTLGRLPKALEVARSFKRAGWRVVIAEPFAWHVSRLSRVVDKSLRVTAPAEDRGRYLDQLLDIIRSQAVDLVVPVSEETMHVASLHDRLPARTTMYAPSQAALLSLHNKYEFIRRAQTYGLAVPETFLASSHEAVALAASGPHVIKPVFSCSGKDVTIIKQAASLQDTQRTNGMIVQKFIPGQVYSSFSIAHKGRRVVTALYKGTVMSGTVSVAFERVENAAAARWIDDFISASNHSGFISFDLIEAADGTVSAIECNPRVTSGAHFIDTRDLARAITDPEAAEPVRFKSQTRFQQFYPCLTETQKSIFKPELRRNNIKNLFSARDVIWEASDPLPFIFMPLTSHQILAMSIFEGLSFGEAATRDIEWTA